MGMRERGGKIKAMPVKNTDKQALQRNIHKHVEQGTVVYTDDHCAYCGLQGYSHETVHHSANEYVKSMTHTNGVESVWAVLKLRCKWNLSQHYH